MIPVNGVSVLTSLCHFQRGKQMIINTKIGDIRFLGLEDFCMTAKDLRNNVKLRKCDGDVHIGRSPPPGLIKISFANI